jgi:ATP-dependent RNA helicase DDX27
MELRKGENMIAHEDEIYARPARTWFQSAREKETAKGEETFVVVTLTHFG